MDVRRFPSSQDGESENHPQQFGLWFALVEEALLFGYFLLGQQEKVTRARQRAEAVAVVYFNVSKGKNPGLPLAVASG